jgi:hypothetical protein
MRKPVVDPTKVLDLHTTVGSTSKFPFQAHGKGSPTTQKGDRLGAVKRPVTGSVSQPTLRKSKNDLLDDATSKHATQNSRPSFRGHLWNEMLGLQKDCSEDTTPWWVSRQAYVTNFFNVPLKLEKFLFYGLLICVDSFLFIFSFLPIRGMVALLTWMASMVRSSVQLTSSQRFDLARCVIFLVSYFLLSLVDGSYLYHFIRGQASLKLYVIFNLIEIFDKLFCSFGQDIFDYLFATLLPPSSSTSSTSSNSSNSNSETQKVDWRTYLGRGAALTAAMIYSSLHSLLLFVKVVTLNVSVNAYNNSLLTLLVSANFVELKGIVFKSFKTENVFQIACSDTVERFQLLVFLIIICVHNLNDLSWQLSQDTIWNIIYIVLIVAGMEVIVDWLKHAFITRFNKMQSSIFQNFSKIIAMGVIQQDDIPDACYTTSKRIGFVSLPLACVVFRVFLGVAPISGLLGFFWTSTLWTTLIATKFIVTLVILSMSVSILGRSASSLKTETKLTNTYAYDKID